MHKQLARVHDTILPPFRPDRAGLPDERPKKSSRVIKLRFQNGRQVRYKRIVLCDKFKQHFGLKAMAAMTDASFVPEGDERLQENVRNDFFAEMVEVYEGRASVRILPFLTAALSLHFCTNAAHSFLVIPSLCARARSEWT